jgi:hypothetical protein
LSPCGTSERKEVGLNCEEGGMDGERERQVRRERERQVKSHHSLVLVAAS